MSERIVATDDHEGHWYTGEEIVRCKDCKWCVEDGAFFECRHFSCHISWNEGQEPDGFCAWGERKVDE